MPSFRCLLLFFLAQSALVASQRSKPSNTTSLWQTLSGNAPVVIARGGFSGLFPDSSSIAYRFTLLNSGPDVIVWCDVQLTKDGVGICAPQPMLNNASNINDFFPNQKKTYFVNGVSTDGWFTVDYTMNDLMNVSLIQGIFSRTPKFDSVFPINTVDEVAQLKPPGYWLNIQHDLFFRDHNLSMRNFVISVSRSVVINYISSPEVGFLRSIAARFRASSIKLVFRFLQSDATEPSTNQTYGALLRNLTFVRTFASGILVPKNYIWPVSANLYLQPHTSLVSDAHKVGLEVFASDFVNDVPIAYNYSYNPLAEVLSFVDNSNFSVDGILSDFSITPAAAIGCFAHIDKNTSQQEDPVIISYQGASGDYPGSTNLAYQKAVEDGADVIDCSVQVTADGVPICLNSIDLLDGTNVAQSPFKSQLLQISEIQTNNGIFSFNLTLKNILETLKPQISSPYLSGYQLTRNPAYANSGKFMTLSDFLTFAKSQPTSGILLIIENAAYLAEKQGIDVITLVLGALNDSGFANRTVQKVTIQSTDSSVLTMFKKQTKYALMYKVDEIIRDANNSTLEDIKKFADSVAISKSSIYPASVLFLLGSTNIIDRLHDFNLSAYVYVLRNEYVSQPWDFLSDPIVEINSYVQGAGVDGIITDFPGTSKEYKRNSCLKMGNDTPSYMVPVPPGGLLPIMVPENMPPVGAPLPVLQDSDVSEPPLPPVSKRVPFSGGSTTPPTSPPSGQPPLAASIFVSMVMLLGSLFLL